jgi:hypothetical protein
VQWQQAVVAGFLVAGWKDMVRNLMYSAAVSGVSVLRTWSGPQLGFERGSD